MPSEEVFLLNYNPATQHRHTDDDIECYTSLCPTLAELRMIYHKNTPVKWLMIQLSDINDFCGAQVKMSAKQIKSVAHAIIACYAALTVNELMLFFLRFKGGKYGRFYGSVDGLAITNALYHYYSQERPAEIMAAELRRRNSVKTENEEHLTWEEWKSLKQYYDTETKEQFIQRLKKYRSEQK